MMKTFHSYSLRSCLITVALTTLLSAHSSWSGEWVSLFDGKSLDGWKTRGGTATYRVVDNCIEGKTVEGSANTFLCTEKEYGDFELELEVLCDVELNSGIQIRSHVFEKDYTDEKKRVRKAGTVYGYQCEIMQSGADAGNFWDEARRAKWLDSYEAKPAAKAALKDKQWNTYRIVAQGDHSRSL